VAINLVAIAILATVLLILRRRYARFFRIQREALDHRKAADAQALAQSQSTEQLIARQYGVINTHNQQVAARTEEALRISSETLAEIRTMNQNLARIAERLDGITGPAA
jgi:type IV secretory pathway component VirB8